MKKVLAFILVIIIISSFAYADSLPHLILGSKQIAMLDDEINKSVEGDNANVTEESIVNPTQPSENSHEENINNKPVETENPITESPVKENNTNNEGKSPVAPIEENNPTGQRKEIQPKPMPSIINSLNKENAWSHKTVYLTFDDGPSSITNRVLDILQKEDVKATFFVIGTKTEEGKSLLKRISDEGHSLGNHTYSHNYNYIYKSVDNFFSDLYKNENVIYEATGTHPKIIRFPGGSNNTVTKTEKGKKVVSGIMDRLEKEGYVHFDWNASSGDASANPASVDDIINNTLTWVSKNNTAVVLFHDTAAKGNTLKALPTIIEKLKFLGCKFEVLNTKSPHIAFIKKDKSTKPETVTVSSKYKHRKPPHVVNKLMKLEMEMEERFMESRY